MNDIPSVLGLTSEQVEAALRAAAAAPSLHNAQPWRFRLQPASIDLFRDPERRLPAADPDDQELRLGCGAALLNLKLALKNMGVHPLVTLLPDTRQPDLLATVRAAGPARPDPQVAELVAAIPRRRTNRHPFTDEPVPVMHRQALVRAAQAEQCWLHVVRDRTERAALRELVVQAHEVQSADPAFRAEMAAWVGMGAEAKQGVPVSAGGPKPEPQDVWVLRDFTGGRARPRVPGKDFEDDPLVVVLCSHHSGPLAELQSGQGMQRVLLTATSLGLSASFLSQVVEVPATRRRLRALLGGHLHPQMVLRIGYGTSVPPVPRRPVSELIVHDTPVL